MTESTDQFIHQILDYYAAGGEETRLKSGIGLIEYERTKEILLRYLAPAPAVIYDIGGATGIYSLWLAKLGYKVHLLELSPANIDRARVLSAQQADHPLASAEVADGRSIPRLDQSADAVMVMGPLYHLSERADRIKALQEAWRVLKPGGLLAAAAITRFGSMLWGLSTYGASNRMLEDPDFIGMFMRELEDGQHIRPQQLPFFTRAFFHLPDELCAEVRDAGFVDAEILAVEGPGWIAPNIDALWAEERSREAILNTVQAVERQPFLIGVSPHMLAVARKEK